MFEEHELFEELDAFDPLWQETYHCLADAVEAASEGTPYIISIYEEYLSEHVRSVDGVPDVLRAIQEAQKAEEESPAFQASLRSLGYVGGDGWAIDKYEDE